MHNDRIQSQLLFELFHEGHFGQGSDGIFNHHNQVRIVSLGPTQNIGHAGKEGIVPSGRRRLFVQAVGHVAVFASGQIGIGTTGRRGPNKVRNLSNIGKLQLENIHLIRRVRTRRIINAPDLPQTTGKFLRQTTTPAKQFQGMQGPSPDGVGSPGSRGPGQEQLGKIQIFNRSSSGNL